MPNGIYSSYDVENRLKKGKYDLQECAGLKSSNAFQKTTDEKDNLKD